MPSHTQGSCAFCDIVAERTPASVVASDPLTVAFLDLRQFHPGQVFHDSASLFHRHFAGQ